DLYGMKVVTDEGEELGELVKIYETGANDVYAVKKAEDKKELLIPAIKDCILKVDIKDHTMTVHLLEGLR
ncbi:MAG: 16S rRNA processing protein RimM, partial [Anaerotignum sp.]|nr:16S rRNA processing protein RimM [Anaerotignum sp.]